MVEEIKKLLGTEKLLLGTERTMKALRSGTLEKIFVAANANPKIVEDIEHYKDIAKIELVKLKESNEELGTICKKSFSISVIGVKN